jgi:pyruvate dehydrogenase E2 component (dihydrolipoamide acetyltransferase)
MDVLMPQLGETVAEGKITKWFKQPGDEVKPGDNLFEIETDKTSMEVPSTVAGSLTAINVGVGDVAKVGAVVAVIGGAGQATQAKSAVQAASQQPPLTPAKAGVPSQSAPRPAALDSRLRGNERGSVFAYPDVDPFREVRTPAKNYGPARVGGRQVTPLARRLAGERGIDLGKIEGSGPHGRIVARDIEVAAPKAATVETPAPLYLVADIEIGRPLALCADANAAAPRTKSGEPAFALSLEDFIVKAWAMALQRVPAANAISSGGGVRRLESSDIAVAVALDEARVTPVIRNAEAKSLTAIAAERRNLKARAHDKTLKPDECQGAASVISNLGGYGIRELASAVEPPRTTLLAVGASRRAPVEAEDGSVRFVSMMTVTLSCDRRAIDDVVAARLLAAFKALVENPVTALV